MWLRTIYPCSLGACGGGEQSADEKSTDEQGGVDVDRGNITSIEGLRRYQVLVDERFVVEESYVEMDLEATQKAYETGINGPVIWIEYEVRFDLQDISRTAEADTPISKSYSCEYGGSIFVEGTLQLEGESIFNVIWSECGIYASGFDGPYIVSGNGHIVSSMEDGVAAEYMYFDNVDLVDGEHTYQMSGFNNYSISDNGQPTVEKYILLSGSDGSQSLDSTVIGCSNG